MPVDNQKTYRFMVLDRCLKNRHRKYTIDDLKDAVNSALEKHGFKEVSKRTIQDDLNVISIEPYNARYEKFKDGHKTIYRYEESFDGIKFLQITDEERNRIEEAINVLERFDGTPQYDWVRFCLQQIVSDTFTDENQTFISFQNNPDLLGIEHFETLLKAIADKQPLNVIYHPYPYKDKDTGKIVYRDSTKYKLHPYHLKQFNNRWYLIAQAEGEKYIGNYPLDRIKSITPLAKKFIPTDIDFDEYFDDAIGVSVRDNVEDVLLKVDKVRYHYIESKPLHPTQTEMKDMETDTHKVIRLKVCLNKELDATILSFGEDLEVLYPESLRNKIAAIVKKTAESYKQSEKPA